MEINGRDQSIAHAQSRVYALSLAASLVLAVGAMCVPVLRGRVIDRAAIAVAIVLSVLSVVFLSITLFML
jgi:hypothetical protein